MIYFVFLDSEIGDADESLDEGVYVNRTKQEWKAGDRCLALWSQDGQ